MFVFLLILFRKLDSFRQNLKLRLDELHLDVISLESLAERSQF